MYLRGSKGPLITNPWVRSVAATLIAGLQQQIRRRRAG